MLDVLLDPSIKQMKVKYVCFVVEVGDPKSSWQLVKFIEDTNLTANHSVTRVGITGVIHALKKKCKTICNAGRTASIRIKNAGK